MGPEEKGSTAIVLTNKPDNVRGANISSIEAVTYREITRVSLTWQFYQFDTVSTGISLFFYRISGAIKGEVQIRVRGGFKDLD